MIYPAFADEQASEVLILNSYHSDFTWTGHQTEGILKELKGSKLNTKIYIEHLKWKQFPLQSNLDNLYNTYKGRYGNKKIDMIITTDDAALEFALKHREELFSNAPIVFSGINEEGELELIHNKTNVTGVIEPIELKETITMALQINPNLKKLYIIHDQTESGKSTYTLVENIIRSLHQDITPISISNATHDEVTQKAQEIEGDGAILMTTYYRDSLGEMIGFEDFCKIISKVSQVPVFHMYYMTMGHGNIGGSMICGTMQGEKAGQLALRILRGEKADQIPIINDKEMKIAFDYEQLKRFNIPMERIPKGVEVINEPFSFFKTYKSLVITTLLILCLLLVFIIILMFYIKEIQRIRNALQLSNEEITQTYEELTASEEELRQQVGELNMMQRKLRKMSYSDELTELPNKRALYKDFAACIKKHKGLKGAIIFIDTDNFKLINDTLGHSVGDEIIIAIGKRIRKLVGHSIKVYRMGGDEFVLLVQKMKDFEEIEEVAIRIIGGFGKGFEIQDLSIHVSISAGIAIFPDHGIRAEQLLMRADIAMYKAKEEGKAKYVFYDSKMNQEIVERAAIEKNLRKAIPNEEFLLYYQPQYNIKTREIIGFEALIRWDSKELGWVMPYKFIQVAEESHMIIPIGKWVLETACKFIKKIHHLGYPDYTIAVNVSLLQVLQDDFVEMVLGILIKYDLDPQYLEIEMTETMLIQNFKLVVDKLGALKEKGVKVALDDFGTGYSSLNYLNTLPLSTLKIDKSFVDTICTQPRHKVILSIIINLGQEIGLKVLAEGVETEEQYAYLHESGCDSLQGYLLSKPVPENEILEML